jgi:hypothetical protein
VPYRYVPRDFLKNPSFFGVRVDADWKPYDSSDLKQAQIVAASYYQHLAACETLRQAGQRGWGMEELATALGVNRHTLSRKLYGHAPADITDMVSWAFVTESVTVLPAPADLGQMLPPP